MPPANLPSRASTKMRLSISRQMRPSLLWFPLRFETFANRSAVR